MRNSTPGFTSPISRMRTGVLLLTSAALLTACGDQPLDFDLRGLGGGFSTAEAATGPLASRPRPDDRGVISYPNYQVAIARRGDTLADVAKRVGVDAASLARFNGIAPDVPLRKDEVIALSGRVAEPSPATGAAASGPIQPVDINALAGGAIDRAPETPGVQTAALPPANTATAPRQTGQEPVRHKVERGETAYTVARLYSVPVKALAEWNGLGADFKVREGQFLLIPVAKQNPPARKPALDEATAPGAGSPTPTPPSAAKPLPNDDTAKPVAKAEEPTEPVADVGKTTKPAKAAKMVTPVKGSIIRAYAKGRNEGINIKAAAGAPVKAADSGTVAAITKSAEGVPIVVVRHAGNLLTVYANVADVSVSKGDTVGRGQQIAKLRSGDDAYVHFEVRQGFDSVDPAPFLN
ncbi:LysM peptidoglycan-binding domain-containing M23 family metallopeptidase [Sulfitobacter sp. F26204]|uniref:LysM peptidoglycan-binding domain-containing M23 family metallopeptidase n=1 Tax=Sulfitobacter sp. F26204 TaxID=2996014 RepID=UPI00225E25F4|nr:LysM peptidoglycan-binding domain-containing M23 family metallopeptidase [Sulfitobacter sp. F26204]MCX7559460.1 LysM peptidoglycan-binding domain-containing M23 family metallopeptidase [Sulfitobacter sp. F26204]